MRITRLEIFGFKSFVDRFVLNFDEPLIGIVGPNGCGKSNIVDALRWVLGETHAKQLRGSLLEDLIFNGTETRRPLGMAEVSITVKPEAGWKPAIAEELEEQAAEESGETSDGVSLNIDAGLSEIFPGLMEAAEIQLTRRLYRSGESEYFINRVPCRLRDMIEVYRMIGLGARGLSIVQQGQVGEFISKKPVERRELLEEAAGISGFRVRMESAERKLERTRTNISRLRDIMVEVEKQVRVLKRQASRAKQRNELKSNLRELDFLHFELRAAKIISERGRERAVFEELSAEVDRRRNELSILDAEQEQSRSALEVHDVQLADHRQKKDALNEEIHRKHVEESSRKIALIQLQEQLTAAKARAEKLFAEKETLSAELSLHQREGASGSAQITREQAERKRIETELNSVLQALEAPTKDGRKLADEIQSLQSEAQHLRAFLNSIGLENSTGNREDALRVLSKRSGDELANQLADASLLIAKSQQTLMEVESQLRHKELERDQLTLKERELREQLSKAGSQLSRMESKISFEQSRADEISRQLAKLETDSAEVERLIQHLGQELGQAERELKVEASQSFEAQRERIDQMQQEVVSVSALIKDLENQREATRKRLAAVSQQVDRLRRDVDSSTSDRSERAMRIERADLELSMLKEDIERLYAESVSLPSEQKLAEHAQDLKALEQRSQMAAEEAQELRKRIEREGEVDPQSIELFEAEDKRLTEMETQHADLEAATKILERTIKQLKEISKTRFLDTFRFVSQKFSELVPQLFGGGSGTLTLLNPEDPLTSGIELQVRPPGKKIKNMELMSGGEKALTATAVLLSMFLYRTSPICVLDEVDAPLDDANLERFLGLIRSIASRTQFLIITHNKQTMNASDRLIGITMQEKGISTALSVTFDEAEQYLDQANS